MIPSSHCVQGWSHVCACDRAPVHSVFKADPIKQTEPGHGRISVEKSWSGRGRGSEPRGADEEQERSTMGGRAQPGESGLGGGRGLRGLRKDG